LALKANVGDEHNPRAPSGALYSILLIFAFREDEQFVNMKRRSASSWTVNYNL